MQSTHVLPNWSLSLGSALDGGPLNPVIVHDLPPLALPGPAPFHPFEAAAAAAAAEGPVPSSSCLNALILPWWKCACRLGIRSSRAKSTQRRDGPRKEPEEGGL